MSALGIGQQLVELCRQGKNREAIEKLYSADIVSVAACAMEGHEKQLNDRGSRHRQERMVDVESRGPQWRGEGAISA